MKISYNWLCQIIPGLDEHSALDIADKLTFSGLEVEGIEDQAKKFKGIVVGEVISKEPHPDADKLSLCQVSSGDQKYQVVCGAKNVEAGKKFPFATLGTVMPDGLEIKPIKLRGVDSNGMLCSVGELEFSFGSDGLLVLDQGLKVGAPISEALKLNDVIFEINITPNRGDALSHWGVARDVSAITGLKLDPNLIVPTDVKLAIPSETEQEGSVTVDIQNAESCGRFSASQIKGLTVKPSPEWLSMRLESLGIRSINNVVDATNYVLLLTGHPVHAYDERQVADHKLIIKTIESDTKCTTLDEAEQKLVKGDLIIADAKGPVGLAGIMGLANSEIKDDTTDIILEVAFFNPDTIRKTSKRLGLQTDSSYRFARFVNPQTVYDAHCILRDLILSLAGGTPSEIIDQAPQEFHRVSIELPKAELVRILGITVDAKDVLRILTGLGCQVEESKEGYVVEPPVARSDLTRPIDLVEEVARLHGLDKIPAIMPRLSVRCSKENDETSLERQVKEFFKAQGFHETLHYSFGDQKYFEQTLKPQSTEHWISLANPISEDLKVMRPSLLPNLLQCYLKNRRQSDAGLRFFELRNIYFRQEGQIQELPVLAGLYTGNSLGRNRFDLNRDTDFFDGKGWLLDLFKQGRIQTVESECHDWPFHPGQSLNFMLNNECLGRVGALHPSLLQQNKIKESVYYIEVNYKILAKAYGKSQLAFKSVTSLPSVYRDLALLVPQELSYQSLIDLMKAEGPEELKKIQLFDLYEGENLPEGKKSLGFSMVYQPKSESLTDEQVNDMHFALVKTLQDKLKVELR